MSAAPAADRVLEVLTLLGRDAEPLPAGLIAARLRLPRSTTYRLLGVLVEHGYVDYDEKTGHFGLGLAAYELGSAYQRQAPLQRLARPIVRALVDRTRQNAHLAMLHGGDVLYLIEERAPGGPSLVTDVGVRLPATLTASGLAMLAALPRRQVRALLPGVSPTQLWRSLVEVRARGHALEDGTVTAGLASVAQPVRDHTGHPLAAIASTFPRELLATDGLPALVAAVTAAADQLSRRLGRHFPDATP